MNPDLEKLIDLHHAETELKRLDAELADVPRLREELEARVARDRRRLDAAREALETSQKRRKQNESEVQDLEGKRSKYKGQLMDVKTNKEYTAMLHEIETVEREIRSREDLILEEMERAEIAQRGGRAGGDGVPLGGGGRRGERPPSSTLARRVSKDERERVAAERERVAAHDRRGAPGALPAGGEAARDAGWPRPGTGCARPAT